jgi:hypothetical protein
MLEAGRPKCQRHVRKLDLVAAGHLDDHRRRFNRRRRGDRR